MMKSEVHFIQNLIQIYIKNLLILNIFLKNIISLRIKEPVKELITDIQHVTSIIFLNFTQNNVTY